MLLRDAVRPVSAISTTKGKKNGADKKIITASKPNLGLNPSGCAMNRYINRNAAYK